MLRKWYSLLQHGSRVSKVLFSTLALFGIVGVSVAEAEARIASLRKQSNVEFILSSFARRSIPDKNK